MENHNLSNKPLATAFSINIEPNYRMARRIVLYVPGCPANGSRFALFPVCPSCSFFCSHSITYLSLFLSLNTYFFHTILFHLTYTLLPYRIARDTVLQVQYIILSTLAFLCHYNRSEEQYTFSGNFAITFILLMNILRYSACVQKRNFRPGYIL